MTLVATAFFPHIINNEYEGEPTALIMVSDSRITDMYSGEYFDVAQKIHQFSSDCIIGYADNVKLAQEVIKSVEYNLQQKKRMFDGHEKFLEYITETIQYKKKTLGLDYNTDFLLAFNDDNNVPRLVFFSQIFKDNYKPHFIPARDKLKIIGQDSSERAKLEGLIYQAIGGYKAEDILQCSIALRAAMKEYIELSVSNKKGKYVGGLIQAMSLRPYPAEAELLNSAILDPITGQVLEITQFNDARQCWIVNASNGKEGITYKYPLDCV